MLTARPLVAAVRGGAQRLLLRGDGAWMRRSVSSGAVAPVASGSPAGGSKKAGGVPFWAKAVSGALAVAGGSVAYLVVELKASVDMRCGATGVTRQKASRTAPSPRVLRNIIPRRFSPRPPHDAPSGPAATAGRSTRVTIPRSSLFCHNTLTSGKFPPARRHGARV